MLNSVSERIRSIIKAQEQPRTQSRSNSIDSGHSSRRVRTPPPPTAGRDPRPAEGCTCCGIRLAGLKEELLGVVYGLVAELGAKIEALALAQRGIRQEGRQEARNEAQVGVEAHGQVKKYIDRQINIIKQECEQLSNKLTRISIPPLSSYRSTSEAPQGLTFRQSVSQSASKCSPNTMSQQAWPAPKCKCQNLVEEILKSQSHLMMELKYLKHFQQSENVYGRIKK